MNVDPLNLVYASSGSCLGGSFARRPSQVARNIDVPKVMACSHAIDTVMIQSERDTILAANTELNIVSHVVSFWSAASKFDLENTPIYVYNPTTIASKHRALM